MNHILLLRGGNPRRQPPPCSRDNADRYATVLLHNHAVTDDTISYKSGYPESPSVENGSAGVHSARQSRAEGGSCFESDETARIKRYAERV